MRRVLQDGQTARPLQEKAIRKSWPQSPHRARAKPCAKMPHARYLRNGTAPACGQSEFSDADPAQRLRARDGQARWFDSRWPVGCDEQRVPSGVGWQCAQFMLEKRHQRRLRGRDEQMTYRRALSTCDLRIERWHQIMQPRPRRDTVDQCKEALAPGRRFPDGLF
jgi:hypothetical protein